MFTRIETVFAPDDVLRWGLIGATENAGLENAGPSKMQGWNMQDWKIRHQIAGVENAEP